jgi:hypothetical protein
MYLHGPWHRARRVLDNYVVVRVFENVGHDEHNCWTEYLILRFK